MILVLEDDGTGAIVGKVQGKMFDLELTWAETDTSTGAKAGLLYMDEEPPSVILSTEDRNELLFYLSKDAKPVTFVRYGSD